MPAFKKWNHTRTHTHTNFTIWYLCYVYVCVLACQYFNGMIYLYRCHILFCMWVRFFPAHLLLLLLFNIYNFEQTEAMLQFYTYTYSHIISNFSTLNLYKNVKCYGVIIELLMNSMRLLIKNIYVATKYIDLRTHTHINIARITREWISVSAYCQFDCIN